MWKRSLSTKCDRCVAPCTLKLRVKLVLVPISERIIANSRRLRSDPRCLLGDDVSGEPPGPTHPNSCGKLFHTNLRGTKSVLSSLKSSRSAQSATCESVTQCRPATFYESSKPAGGAGFLHTFSKAVEWIEWNPNLFPRKFGTIQRVFLERSYFAVNFFQEPERSIVIAVLDAIRSLIAGRKGSA